MSERAHDVANSSIKASVTRGMLRKLFTLFAEALCPLRHEGTAAQRCNPSSAALDYLHLVVGRDDRRVCHADEEAALDYARQEL